MPTPHAEEVAFTSDYKRSLMGDLNKYLTSPHNSDHRLISVQQLSETSRLATERTYEWTRVYLIVWEVG